MNLLGRKDCQKKTKGGSFLFYILFIFRERGREGERKGEKHQCMVASHVPPIGDLARNPGMCPDWESNQRPFGSKVSTQSTEPHQPGQRKVVSVTITANNMEK